jgi:hypothetical protein
VTERSRRGANGDGAPLLTTAYATGEPGSFPPARALARAFPVDQGRRILIAVAAGIGDPPSAEAQSLEALGRLEAVVARAAGETPARAVLQAGFDAADDGIARLKSLPGSVQHAGVVMVAAVVDGLTATFATLGTPAALLRRGEGVRRLTAPAVRGRRALGMGGPVEPEFTGPIALGPGDSVVLCTQAVLRDLGEQVVEAVFEEFGPEDAAHDLADLAAQQPGSDGAAVALLHFPAGADAATLPVEPLEGAAAVAAMADVTEPLPPPPPQRQPRPSSPGWLPWAIGALAAIVGALAVIAVVRSQGGLGASSSRNGTATEVVSAPGFAPGLATGTPAAATVQRTSTAATPAAAASRGPSAIPTARAAPTLTPGAAPATAGASTIAATPAAAPTLAPLASLPACDSSNTTPCAYTAKAGDSMSVIGDRFNLTAACFVAANPDTVGVPVALPNPTIALAQVYRIPSPAECTALAAAAPAATSAPAPATPTPACTPRPGATAPPPDC